MNHLATQPLLEWLRPPAGWRTDRAILSAYSAEPAVLVAILLSLAGHADDSGSGSRVALARALTELRGRVWFVLQRGRFAAPRRASQVLSLLDRFVCEVPWDEAPRSDTGRSWHAKIALVRTVPCDSNAGQVQWRLWLGSRNFTLDTSWDIGLSLETVISRAAGTRIPGIVQMATRLAARAGQSPEWRSLAAELSEAKWEVPQGLEVKRVVLMLPDDADREIPSAPEAMERLIAVAPFLDGASLNQLGNWGDKREILSSMSELARLNAQTSAPLEGFDLFVLPSAPEDGAGYPEERGATLEAVLEARGLHAKFLWAEHRGHVTMWLGSPNLTRRGWTRNAEAYAEISVNRRKSTPAAEALCDGIEAFREIAKPVQSDELGEAVDEDPVDEALERARGEVAARLSGFQSRGEGSTIVKTPAGPPHPEDMRITLEVSRMGGAMRTWTRSTTTVELPLLDAAETELIMLRVSLEGKRITWAQLVPFEPPLDLDRDMALLGDYLGAREILSWISNELDDVVESDGGGAWDEDRATGPQSGARTVVELPTVEKALRTWTRDPDRLDAVDRILRGTQAAGRDDDETDARMHLDAFARSWRVLRAGLPGRTGRVD